MTTQAEQWLLDHIKGLHIRTDYGETIYTSMFARIEDMPYLLTTGHALEEIDAARKKAIKIRMATVIPTNGTEAFPIVDLEETPLYYLHKRDSIDIGLLPLRPFYESQIKNETFITARHYSDLPPRYSECMLIGFPSAYERFTPNHVAINPAYVSVRRTWRPRDIPEAVPTRFFGKITAPIDLKGMSGGPIIGFLHNQESNEVRCWIIALQSGWYKSRHLICGTKLETSIPVLLRRYDLRENIGQPRQVVGHSLISEGIEFCRIALQDG